jgi:MFS family permease
MKASHTHPSGMVRWYPAAWRERYGDEMAALIEDQLGDQTPTLRFRLSIARAGLRERAIGSAIVGRSAAPSERARTGALIVLGAWSAFVIAGASFSKLAEHFPVVVPATHRAWTAFQVVQIAALIAASLFAGGIVIALPAVSRFLRAGGWSTVRRSVLRSAVFGGAAVTGTIGLTVWAHAISSAQRNGTDAGYGVAFVVWAVLVAATICVWARAGIAIGRQIQLSRRQLALESGLAIGVAGAMCTMTVSTAIWWASMAVSAPWFLDGSPVGTAGSPVDLQLIVTMAVMLASVVAGGYGVARIGRSWADMLRGTS